MLVLDVDWDVVGVVVVVAVVVPVVVGVCAGVVVVVSDVVPVVVPVNVAVVVGVDVKVEVGVSVMLVVCVEVSVVVWVDERELVLVLVGVVESVVVRVDVRVVVALVVAVVVGVVTSQLWNPPPMYASVIALMVSAASLQSDASKKYLSKPHFILAASPAGPRNSEMAVLSTPTVVSHDSASFRMFVVTPLSSVASHDIALTDDEHVFSTAFKTSRCESQSCVGLTYSSEPSASDVHSNAPLKTVVVCEVVCDDV